MQRGREGNQFLLTSASMSQAGKIPRMERKRITSRDGEPKITSKAESSQRVRSKTNSEGTNLSRIEYREIEGTLLNIDREST